MAECNVFAVVVTMVIAMAMLPTRGVLADLIFGSRVGQMAFPAESKEPKLSVVFWPPPSTTPSTAPSTAPSSPSSPAALPVDEPGLESVVMAASDGKRYRCILPPPNLASPHSSAAGGGGGADGVDAKGGAAGVAYGESRKSPEDLLDAMKGLPCFYRQDGWWTYEFCYKKHIRQMHIEQQDGENKVTMDFVLGRYSARESLRAQKRLEAATAAGGGAAAGAGKRYHVHVYTNGTSCDLTGAGRRTEVRMSRRRVEPRLVRVGSESSQFLVESDPSRTESDPPGL
ncbi:hypothetical protein CLOM_g6336 [Closterium sp. NIES-68]|nr:hypothetical protein CLOM_g6336 [Closterium sp. NIES-68]